LTYTAPQMSAVHPVLADIDRIEVISSQVTGVSIFTFETRSRQGTAFFTLYQTLCINNPLTTNVLQYRQGTLITRPVQNWL